MGVSIIRLYSEVADVLDHIDFEAHVLGITQEMCIRDRGTTLPI